MKVALLDATGFVGSALLKEALDRGHTVTAIVRQPEKLERRGGLIAKAGDVYDTTPCGAYPGQRCHHQRLQSRMEGSKPL
jgi:putative NADH-flavin reductase